MKKLLLYLLVIISITTCSDNKEYIYNKFIVGASCEVKFYCSNDSLAKQLINDIDYELTRIDSLLNRFSDKSLISILNNAEFIQAPNDIINLFILCDSISRLTNGLFDISVAPLLEIWGFYDRQYTVPDTADLIFLLDSVDFTKIKINKDTITIAPGMRLDLAGIAQGYAADRVALILRKHHVASAIINIGGEIKAIGCSPEGRPWRVGIKHPRAQGIVETVELSNYALSTSGDYEKFFVLNNQRYPHIINPISGYPAQGFASVTIFAENAAFADAIATAAALMEPKRCIKFLDSLQIKGIIYFDENGHLQRKETD